MVQQVNVLRVRIPDSETLFLCACPAHIICIRLIAAKVRICGGSLCAVHKPVLAPPEGGLKSTLTDAVL